MDRTMNPYIIKSIVDTILGLKRVCPKCRKTQVVSSEIKYKAVRCKFCGTEIPAKHQK